MKIQGYFTEKGLALTAKLLTGSELKITQVAAGDGDMSEPSDASLFQPRQTLAVNPSVRNRNTVTLPVTLVAAMAETDYILTELGVYADDPDEGEILYKIYKLEEPVDITAGSRMVLRFYLEETVSEDMGVTVTCSPTGLITEEDFSPVREKVMAAATGSRTVHLEASELQAYLDALPRLLNENVTIYVSGELPGWLMITDFYGNGSLNFRAENDTLGQFIINGGVTVGSRGQGGSAVKVSLYDVQFERKEGNWNMIHASGSAVLYLTGCTLQGEEAKRTRALFCIEGAVIRAYQCSIRGFYSVASTENGGTIVVEDCTGENNVYGALTWRSGTVFVGGSTPNSMGGSVNLKSGGGLVVSNTGTIL